MERNENWQDYVDMFADALEQDHELMVIPIFSNAGFTKGNVMVISGCAARALAGVGTAEDIQSSRRLVIAKRSELRPA